MWFGFKGHAPLTQPQVNWFTIVLA